MSIEGFLSKKGRGKSLSFRRPWAIRFFVLDPDAKELRYYSGSGPTREKNIRGRLSLTGGAVFDVERGDKPYMFEYLVRGDDGHELLTLSASSADEKRRWMEGIAMFSKSDIRPSETVYRFKESEVRRTTEIRKVPINDMNRKLVALQQGHIVDAIPHLSENHPVYRQLQDIDIEATLRHLKAAKNEATHDPTTLRPVSDTLQWSNAPVALKQELENLGFDAIRKGQVAAVILSGGQGTRLGFDGPKGMYSIGLPSSKSIFQLHIERLDRVRVLAAELAGPGTTVPRLPVYVMTSESNNNIIQDFFEEKNFFDYPREDIYFFEQGLLPCLTLDGKIIVQSDEALAMAPDGNGGVFPALQKSGAFQNMIDRNVKHIHLYGIDNVLTKAADPAFMGFCIKHNCEVANKVVARANAAEKVGVSATRNGKLCIVEYSELPESMTGSDASGKLIYSAANICNHYFSVQFLRDKVLSGLNSFYHLANKKIPYYDPVTKRTVKPDANNGVKLEMFVFDVFPLADRWKIMEVSRDDEFAPVKNAPGTATDSPDTARALISAQAIKWLTAAGARLNASDGDSGDCEVSPLISYAGEGLQRFRGVGLTLPVYISDGVARESTLCGDERILEVLGSHHPPEKTMKYGTAGFRDEWTKLHAIFIRMGVLAVLRSRSSGGKCCGVMITASHNPEKDNGIKIVDTDGGMLSQEWEPLAEEIANLKSVVDVLHYINVLEERFECGNIYQNASVIVGRDTRPHSKELFDCVCAGVRAMGGTVLDLGEVTTPQLHFVVQATNVGEKNVFDDFHRETALAQYHSTLMMGYIDLKRSSPNEGPSNVVVDGAFGVGGISIVEFVRTLGAYCNTKSDLSQYSLEVDLRNGVGQGKVNEDCGAEIVQKGQRPPCNFDASKDAGKLMCSYDGDADRIVFQSYLPLSGGEATWVLFDGDKIASLVSAFLIEELRAAGLTEGSDACAMGVVQTAYANGASTDFLRSRGIEVAFAKTGVKYCHHEALRFDVGVYFEANGHGTVLFSKKCATMICNADAQGDARKAIAIRRLKACLLVINQAVGDAVSDMLLCLIALQILGMSTMDWHNMYSDYPSRQTKVPVTNKDLITCTADEMRAVEPAAMQKELDEAMAATPQGRCFVRPSGTEDYVRVYAEAADQESADELARSCVRAINNHVGVLGELPLTF